ncbi:Ribokinase-like protein [Thozetella sp. PMI_491]|nr:Ribokinase-like protein [Thozetella sp. PMI_491]
MDAPQARILVVGSLNMDFILKVDTHAARGGHVQANEQMEMPGGHGANQAVACRRLSRHRDASQTFGVDIQVSIVGAIGESNQDQFGERVKAKLIKEGVEVNMIRSVPEKTGFAHIHVDAAGEPRVTNWPGANYLLLPNHVPQFDPALDMILVQLEIPMETAEYVIESASEAGVPVLLNAAPSTPKVHSTMYKVDYLVVNQLRADDFMGWETKERDPKEYLEVCETYHRFGARLVTITLGEHGAVASKRARRGNATWTWTVPGVSVPFCDLKDTTGGSDAFIGAFAVELLRQKKMGEAENVENALNIAVSAGGYVVKGFGSMDTIPFRDEAEKFRAGEEV